MRQLRIYFAAHEMAEKRRYTRKADAGKKGRDRRPHFTHEEVRRLIGGQRSDSADAALSSDIHTLARLGLVAIAPHSIAFAKSISDLSIEAGRDDFAAMLDRIPNNRRSVPVPRRTCRALAAGFGRATTGVMIALMIRSLYWHRPTADGGGGYRTDGRTKGSWIADVFHISRRGVTDARTKLIDLGWITPLDAPQWQLNKWGQHDRLNADWSPTQTASANTMEEGASPGESASPNTENAGEIATPRQNRSTPSSKESLETRKPTPTRPDPSGDCLQAMKGKGPSPVVDRRAHPKTKPQQKAGQGPSTPDAPPKISDIQLADLRSTDRLLHLYRQAIEKDWAVDSEAGQLEFLALAERARAKGKDAARLFAWLLRHNRRDFITQSDEDAAAHRLREHRNGPAIRQSDHTQSDADKKREPTTLTDTDKKVRATLQAATQSGHPPAEIAYQAWGWTTEEWALYSNSQCLSVTA